MMNKELLNNDLMRRIETAFSESSNVIENSLLDEMLSNIGSLDEKLRDEVIYSSFAKALKENRLSDKQKNYLLNQVFERNLLFAGIDKGKTDDTPIRTFSALLLASLVRNHNKNQWMNSEQLITVKRMALNYLLQETDNRGYVEGKGWYHAFAHGADLIVECVKSGIFSERDIVESLQAIKRAFIEFGDFNQGEGNRLMRIVTSLWEMNLMSEIEVSDFLKTLYLEAIGTNDYDKIIPVLMTLENYFFIAKFSNQRSMAVEKTVNDLLAKFYDENEKWLP
jgi:hypothetical protein